jgi:hypothetical protein
MRLLIQDDIIDKMDVYVDYTIDLPNTLDAEVIIYDYGLELTGDTVIVSECPLNGLQGCEIIRTTSDTSLRGYVGMEWMVDKITAYVEHEEGIIDERFQ